MASVELPLNDDLFKSFKLAKTFKQAAQPSSPEAHLLAMDFDDSGIVGQ